MILRVGLGNWVGNSGIYSHYDTKKTAENARFGVTASILFGAVKFKMDISTQGKEQNGPLGNVSTAFNYRETDFRSCRYYIKLSLLMR